MSRATTPTISTRSLGLARELAATAAEFPSAKATPIAHL
jgi:hypothetical protein